MKVKITSKCGRVLETSQENLIYDNGVWYAVNTGLRDLLVFSIHNKDIKSMDNVP